MPKTIQIIVSPTGDITIDAVGFKGADCERATAYLEKALGMQNRKVKKPEYRQQARTTQHQKIGS